VTDRQTTYAKYDTRCYFNVRSKADVSRLNLPDVLRSIGKQSEESVESVRKKKGRLPWEEFAESEKEGLSLG